MTQMKHYKNYLARQTKIVWLGTAYRLSCNSGIFALYDQEGRIFARTCKAPFIVKEKAGALDGLIAEPKFGLTQIIPGLLALKDLETNTLQDVLFYENEHINVGLFLYICQALKYAGFGETGDPFMKINQKGFNITFGYEDLFLRVTQGCAIFRGDFNSNYFSHVKQILEPLGVSLFQELG